MSAQDPEVPATSRDVLFEILYMALLQIRVSARGPSGDLVWVLANMMHNLAHAIRDARSHEDFDEILFQMWAWCPDDMRDWMRSVCLQHGIDPKRFPPTIPRVTGFE